MARRPARGRLAGVIPLAAGLAGALAAASLPAHTAAADPPTIAITQPVTLGSLTCPESGNPLFCYQPESVTTATGGSVTWTNQTLLTHTATVDGVFSTGDIPPGQSVTITVQPGTYHYHCVHHNEAGVLVVPAPPPTPAIVVVPGTAGQISGAGAATPTVVQAAPPRPIIIPGPRGSTDLPPVDTSPAPSSDLPPVDASPSSAPAAAPSPVSLAATPTGAQTERSPAFYAAATLLLIGGLSIIMGVVCGALALRRRLSGKRSAA